MSTSAGITTEAVAFTPYAVTLRAASAVAVNPDTLETDLPADVVNKHIF